GGGGGRGGWRRRVRGRWFGASPRRGGSGSGGAGGGGGHFSPPPSPCCATAGGSLRAATWPSGSGRGRARASCCRRRIRRSWARRIARSPGAGSRGGSPARARRDRESVVEGKGGNAACRRGRNEKATHADDSRAQ